MLEKGKISQFQLFSMVGLFLFGSTTILRSINIAGRNTWLSSIIALIMAGGIITLLLKLAQKYPDKTLVEYTRIILGKRLGSIVALLYLWYFLHLGALVLRNFGELLATAIMPETPMWFFHLTLALVAALMVYSQLEVVARTSEVVLPFIVGLSLTTTFLVALTGHIDWKFLFPLFPEGIKPVLLGSIPIISFPYGEIIIFTMIFPYLNKAGEAKKSTLAGLAVGWLMLFLILVEDIALFGEYMASLTFPRFFAVKLISVGDFIERIEPFVLAVWLMAGLIKISICLYAFVLGSAQLFGLKQYNSLVLPAITLMVTLAGLLYDNVFEMLSFAVNIYPFYAFPFQIGFPALMLLLATLKQRKKAKPAIKTARQPSA